MVVVVILVLSVTSLNLFGQDSLIVYQKNPVLFSNRYIFYSDGTFKHFFSTDDAQFWYGSGKFIDKGRKRILKFGDPDLNYTIEFGRIHYESNFERILKKRKKGKKFQSKDYYHTTKKKFVFFEERKIKAPNFGYTPMPAEPAHGKFAASRRTWRICWHARYSRAFAETEKEKIMK